MYGAFSGLLVLILVSDFIFQQRMLFGPPFLFACVSLLFHVFLLIYELLTETIDDDNAVQWVLFVEGLIDN